MATGDPDDIASRVVGQLPPWFGDVLNDDPLLGAQVAGVGSAFSWVYGFIQFVRQQMRLLTQTGAFIDLTAYDFFNNGFRRRAGELDASWIARIQKEIFRPRQTRDAIKQVVEDLTGNEAVLFEPWNPQDCGGYDIPQAMGYDTAGLYGSYDLPATVFVQAYNSHSEGIPNVAGYDSAGGGYDSGGIAYIDESEIQGPITAADILDAINQTRAVGVTVWAQVNP